MYEIFLLENLYLTITSGEIGNNKKLHIYLNFKVLL